MYIDYTQVYRNCRQDADRLQMNIHQSRLVLAVGDIDCFEEGNCLQNPNSHYIAADESRRCNYQAVCNCRQQYVQLYQAEQAFAQTAEISVGQRKADVNMIVRCLCQDSFR